MWFTVLVWICLTWWQKKSLTRRRKISFTEEFKGGFSCVQQDQQGFQTEHNLPGSCVRVENKWWRTLFSKKNNDEEP